MNYRVTCLTPTLVGGGERLSPIDYMVWRDQVNVLDQERIFRMLARGPRLEGYLQQIRKAEKLDFASWGGFAQNYSSRRIPFESSSCTRYWAMANAPDLFIPTFVTDHRGAYLPGSALKGALRTAYSYAHLPARTLAAVTERLTGERPSRRPGLAAEEEAVGRGGSDRLRAVALADSAPADRAQFQIYLVRTASLVERKGGLTLAWQQAPRGTTERLDQSTPEFAEMANPGAAFSGTWREPAFLQRPEVGKSLRWRESPERAELLRAANEWAAALLAAHRRYAQQAQLELLDQSLAELEQRVHAARDAGDRCLLALGWGTGFLGKSLAADAGSEEWRAILRTLPYYQRAIQTGLPFPKTRRVVFFEDKPAALTGWVELSLESTS